ncbi:unnamed protein product [Lupinus luteus]|uniref:Uncharacterized protein n=1 Tax=Lupinus luteus TaxID=3873 RepID=A0AAV1Y7H8_LUPLU
MANFNVEFKKSKSVVFFSRHKVKDMEGNKGNKGTKKIGFWSKLFKWAKKDSVP